MKKCLLLLFFTLFSFSAIHAEQSGVSGNINWNLSDDGTLTISGTGNMPDYYSSWDAPWYKYNQKIKTVVIENGVTNIGDCAFYYCKSLTSITIPNSVTSIGKFAFYGCSGLTSVTIGNSVTSIGERAFYGCSSLTSVTIGNSVTSIGNCAFANCTALTSVTIGNSVTSIGYGAFDGCTGLTSITIPNSVTSIGGNAFYGCTGLTSITIPNSVTSIGGFAFYDCSSLTSITIPNSMTSIGQDAFSGCSGLTSITIPNSVTSIGNCAFANCTALTSITIPNSVKSIGVNAFSGCSNLTSVTIGNSVTSIGGYAFSNCSGLTSITFEGSTHPEFGEDVFVDVNKSVPVYVPFGSRGEYKNALKDFGLSNIQALPPLSLNDNVSYTRDSQIDGIDVSYTRNFTNVNWQAIYLPFSLKYDDLKDDFELAYINTVRQYDKDNDGVIDKTEMEIIKIKSGSTKPNMPYLIRAKKTGEKTFSAENATVYAAEENSVDCSTTIAKYTITGTYKPIPSETMIANNYYGMGGGKLIQSDGSNGLNPYRWYMKVESRDSRYNMSNAAKAITISVLDDESETTGIDELFASSPASQFQITNDELPVYDMNGRKVNENSLKPGIYVKNGKKFVVK